MPALRAVSVPPLTAVRPLFVRSFDARTIRAHVSGAAASPRVTRRTPALSALAARMALAALARAARPIASALVSRPAAVRRVSRRSVRGRHARLVRAHRAQEPPGHEGVEQVARVGLECGEAAG